MMKYEASLVFCIFQHELIIKEIWSSITRETIDKVKSSNNDVTSALAEIESWR